MDATDENLPAPSLENAEPQTQPPAPAPEVTPLEAITDALREGRMPDEEEPALKAPPEVAPEPAIVDPVEVAAEAPKPAPVPEEDPYAQATDLSPDEVDPKLTKIRARIESTRTEMRELRKEAQFSRMMKDVAKAGNLAPDDLAWLLTTGAAANAGDPAAQAELAAMVQRNGWSGAPAAAAAPAPAPAPAPADALAAKAEAIYQAKFHSRVESLKIDEDVARELATEQAHDALSQPQIQNTPAPQAAPPRAPTTDTATLLRQAAYSEMDRIDTAMKQALGPDRWKQVYAKANALVKTDRESGKLTSNPMTWVSDWQVKLRQAQQALLPVAPPVTTSTGLRAGTGQGGATPKPTGRAAHFAAVAAALASGNLDALPD